MIDVDKDAEEEEEEEGEEEPTGGAEKTGESTPPGRQRTRDPLEFDQAHLVQSGRKNLS